MTKSAFPIFLGLLLLMLGAGCSDDSDAHGSPGMKPGPAAETAGETRPTSAGPEEGADPIIAVLDEPDLFLRAEKLAALLRTFDESRLSEVKKAIEIPRVGGSVADFALLFRFWAALEPAEAAEWSLEVGHARFKAAAVHTAFEAWGATDPSEALAGVLAANLSDADTRRVAQMALYEGWFSHDRAGLEEYARSLGPGQQRQRVIYAYALSLASADGTKAVTEWAESIPDEPRHFKESVFRQVMNALVWVDVNGAVAWCERQCDGEWGRSLRMMIMRGRLRSGESGAPVLEWIATMPSETEEQAKKRDVALRTTFATWVYRDAAEALEWMKRMTSAADRPEWLHLLYPRYALLLASDSPRDAMAQAEQIVDRDRREGTMIRVAQIWREADEQAADAWIDQSPLSDEARERARKPLPDPL